MERGAITVAVVIMLVVLTCISYGYQFAQTNQKNIVGGSVEPRMIFSDTPSLKPQDSPPSGSANYLLYVVNEDVSRANGYVSVVNGTTGQIIKNVTAGYIPTVVEPGKNNSFLYVSDTAISSYGEISVINTFSMNVVSTIKGLCQPSFMAFSPNGSTIYVVSHNRSLVYIVSTESDTVVGSIPVGGIPCGIVMASNGSDMYVSNGNNVSVVSTSTDSVLYNITGFSNPAGLAITPNGSELLVANFDPPKMDLIEPNVSGISIVNLTRGDIVENVTTGKLPNQIAISQNGSIAFVTNSYSDHVSAVNIAEGKVIANISVQSYPEEVVLSPDSSMAYVSDLDSNNVSVIDTSTMRVVDNITGFISPWGIYYLKVPVGYNVEFNESGLPSNSTWSVRMNDQVVSSKNKTLYFQEENGSYSYDICNVPGFYPLQKIGTVTVNGFNRTVNVTFVPVKYNVNFFENGLPTNTTWHVDLNGDLKSSKNNTISFSEPNGTYPFRTGTIPGYRSSNVSGSVTVNASFVDVNITFTQIRYMVTFHEEGLPLDTAWIVNLSGMKEESSNSSIKFMEPNGTFHYNVGEIAGYMSSSPSGPVNVNGSAVVVNITFTQVKYNIFFNETGLPTGQEWFATLSGERINSTTPSICFSEPNGSYTFRTGTIPGYASSKPYGHFVVNGTAVYLTIQFTQLKYTVTFMETGLPSGVSWYINLTGEPSLKISTSSYSLDLPNGSYSLTTSTWDKLFMPYYTGEFAVNGSSVSFEVNFTLVTYKVVFSETDLKSGTEWGVNLTLTGNELPGSVTALNVSSTMPYFYVDLPNGTYNFTAFAHGYRSYSSTITVRGIGTEAVISFHKITSTLILAILYGVTIAAIIVVIVGTVTILRKRNS